LGASVITKLAKIGKLSIVIRWVWSLWRLQTAQSDCGIAGVEVITIQRGVNFITGAMCKWIVKSIIW
jgi:hypothetical protein